MLNLERINANTLIFPESESKNKELKPNELKEQWTKMAETYGWSEYELEVALPAFLERIGDVKGKKVLDLGSGPGNIATILAERGAIVTGVERSEGMIARAKKQEDEKKQGIRYIQSDLVDLDKILQEEKFDIVIFSYVLHNLDPEKMPEIIRKASEKIEKGGKIVAMDPSAVFEEMQETGDTTRKAIENSSYMEHHQVRITLNQPDGKTPTEITHIHRPLSEYINAFSQARMLPLLTEVAVPERLKSKYPKESEYPFVQIIEAEKI